MKKTQLQLIDSGLFLYGTIVTFILTITAFFNLNHTNSIFTLVLFLPVFIYFALKVFSSAKYLFQFILNSGHHKHANHEGFSLTNFVHQSETTFLINLALLCFAIALILIRLSLQNLK